MKAVIVDIDKMYAAALSDNGNITKIRNRDYKIGQVIEIKKMPNFSGRLLKISAIAASFLMVMGIGAFTYFHNSTYVSLDVNPSVEFSLNMYDRVLSVKGANDDGSQILENVNLDNLGNKTIDEAIKMTVQKIAEFGYFDGDTTGEMVITTSGSDLKKASALADELKQVSEQAAKDCKANVEVEAEGVGKDRVEQARALGITPGKLKLIEKLKASASDPDSIKVEDWKNKSVKDIQKATRANRIESALPEDQKAAIEPALEAFKTAAGKAGDDFNTAFEAIKTNYTQQINNLKAQYADSKELQTKLNELRAKMLEERRTEMTKLSDAVKAAKDTFLQATANLGISEDVLTQYIKAITEKTVNPNDGFKDFLKLFNANEKAQANENSKTESKTQTKGNESKTDNGNKGTPGTGDGTGKGNGNGNTDNNGKGGSVTASQAQTGSASTGSFTTESKPASDGKTGEQKTDNDKQGQQPDQKTDQQQDKGGKGK